MAMVVMRLTAKSLHVPTHILNVVHRTIKAHIVLMISKDVMAERIVRMVTMRRVARKGHVLHKNSDVIMDDAYLRCGCGKLKFVL